MLALCPIVYFLYIDNIFASGWVGGVRKNEILKAASTKKIVTLLFEGLGGFFIP